MNNSNNQVQLIGRFTKDIEVIDLGNDKKVANVVLAVQSDRKNENGEYNVEFIKCTLWNDTAENTAKYCAKGSMVKIDGQMKNESYEKDGQKFDVRDAVKNNCTICYAKSILPFWGPF